MSNSQVVVPAMVAMIALGGQWLVARYSKRANDKTAEVQSRADSIDGMDKLVHNLETRLEKVEGQVERQAERIRSLEDERIKDKSLIRNLWAYVITLRDRLRGLGEPIPEAPGGLDFDSPLV